MQLHRCSKIIIILSLLFIGCAEASMPVTYTPQPGLPRFGHMQKLTLDTLWSKQLDSARADGVYMRASISILYNSIDAIVAETTATSLKMASLKITADSVRLMAMKDSIISYINVSPGTIKISSAKILLDGAVVAASLTSKTINGVSITGSEFTTVNFNSGNAVDISGNVIQLRSVNAYNERNFLYINPTSITIYDDHFGNTATLNQDGLNCLNATIQNIYGHYYGSAIADTYISSAATWNAKSTVSVGINSTGGTPGTVSIRDMTINGTLYHVWTTP